MGASTPEGKIKRKLDKMLKAEGVFFFSPQAGPYGSAGIPDRVICAHGLFIGVECKADRSKKPTALQEIKRDEIVAAGGAWFLVYDDATIEDVRKYISARSSRSQGSST